MYLASKKKIKAATPTMESGKSERVIFCENRTSQMMSLEKSKGDS